VTQEEQTTNKKRTELVWTYGLVFSSLLYDNIGHPKSKE